MSFTCIFCGARGCLACDSHPLAVKARMEQAKRRTLFTEANAAMKQILYGEELGQTVAMFPRTFDELADYTAAVIEFARKGERPDKSTETRHWSDFIEFEPRIEIVSDPDMREGTAELRTGEQAVKFIDIGERSTK